MTRGMAFAPSRGQFRYWGIYMLNSGAAGFALMEVELRATAGGADVTTPSTPVAVTSGSNASNLVDNNNGTWWTTSVATNQRVSFDLGAPTDIRQVAMYPYTATAWNPTNFIIQGSHNGSAWVDLRSLNDIFWTANVQRTFGL
jgi:hypothetical protein